MCNGLSEAGATLRYVYDPDPVKGCRAFRKSFPNVKVMASPEQQEVVFDDPETRLVAGAAGDLGTVQRWDFEQWRRGKNYFTDKAPLTTLEQLEAAKACVQKQVKIHVLLWGTSAL